MKFDNHEPLPSNGHSDLLMSDILPPFCFSFDNVNVIHCYILSNDNRDGLFLIFIRQAAALKSFRNG